MSCPDQRTSKAGDNAGRALAPARARHEQHVAAGWTQLEQDSSDQRPHRLVRLATHALRVRIGLTGQTPACSLERLSECIGKVAAEAGEPARGLALPEGPLRSR